MSRKTRKLMWSVPLIAAVAVIGALAAFVALGTGSLFANELPDNPQNLNVEPADGDAGRTTLVLTWDAPASGEPDMYRIDVSTNNQKFTNLTEVAGNVTTYSYMVRPRGKDRKATDGWERFYRVYAKNSHGYGIVSTSESATTDDLSVPGEVTNVNGSSGGPTYNTLSWPMPDDGGSDILGYCIFAVGPGDTAAMGNSPTTNGVTEDNCRREFLLKGAGKMDANRATGVNATNGDVIRILPATTYTHKGLRASQDWEYQVYAFNRYGNSEETSGTRDAITQDAREPTAPVGLKLVQGLTTTGGPQINVYWNAPDDGGQNVTSYRVEVTTDRSSWPETLTGTTAINAEELTGMKDSTIALLADTVETEAFVAAITLTVATQTAGEPYQLQHTITETPPGDATTWRGDTLYYRVQTITNNGDGNNEMMSPFSDEVDVTVVDDTDTSPTIEYTPTISAPVVDADINDGVQNDSDGTNDDDESNTTPGNGPDDDTTPGEIKINITTSSAGANSYRVDISDDEGETWTTVHGATLPISKTEYQHRGLKPEEALHFRLFGKRGSDVGMASNVVLDYAGNTDQPGAVRSLLATSVGAGSISVSWSAPEDDGGAAVEQYCIIANKLNADDKELAGALGRTDIVTNMIRGVPEIDPLMPNSCTRLGEPDIAPISMIGDTRIFQVDSGTTSVTLKSLEQETRWQVEVFALNDASDMDVNNDGTVDTGDLHGVSLESDPQNAGTSAAVVPGAPQRLTAQLAKDTNVGQPGVLILWNPPANPPGAPVEKYKIERMIDDGEFITRRSSHDAGETHWADPNEPPPGEVWTYRVSAINAVGTGTEMATAMIPYPAADHMHPPGTVGDASGLTTAPDTAAGTAVLTWTEGDNANIHWVLGIAVNADDSFDFGDRKWMQVDSGSPYTVTGLTPGKTYAFAIISGYYDASLTPDTRWSEWTWAADDVQSTSGHEFRIG